MKNVRQIAALVAVVSMLLFALGFKAGEMKVKWLESVVTERWIRTGPASWESAKPAIYGQVGDCVTVIGLREDGVVVWKYRE